MRIEPYTDISGNHVRETICYNILWKNKNTNRSYLQLTDKSDGVSG